MGLGPVEEALEPEPLPHPELVLDRDVRHRGPLAGVAPPVVAPPVEHAAGLARPVGSFLKSYDDMDDCKVYYKLSDYRSGNGIVGHECVNEVVVDRLREILGIPHLSYRLIHANVMVEGAVVETWLNASYDFEGLEEATTPLWRDAVWSMIWQRWCNLENIRIA